MASLPRRARRAAVSQEPLIDVQHLQARTISPCSARYHSNSTTVCRQWYSAQFLPVFSHRRDLVNRVSPSWSGSSDLFPTVPLSYDFAWRHLDGWGWLWIRPYRAPWPDRHRPVETAHSADRWQVSPVMDRALRTSFWPCASRRRSPSHFLFMPEGVYHQSLYRPAARAQMDDYLQQLSVDTGVPLLDLRSWAVDADFSDGAHLLPNSALDFSARLEREVVRPALAHRRVATP